MMAYRKYKRAGGRSPRRITHGKVFRTRKGKLGCYKYVNGRKVAFVRKGRRY